MEPHCSATNNSVGDFLKINVGGLTGFILEGLVLTGRRIIPPHYVYGVDKITGTPFVMQSNTTPETTASEISLIQCQQKQNIIQQVSQSWCFCWS